MSTLEESQAENSELRSRLGDLQHELRCFQTPWLRWLTIGDDDLGRLLDRVHGEYPKLVMPSFEAAKVAFAFLATVNRSETVNHKHYLERWTNRAEGWAKTHSGGGRDLTTALMPCAIAWSDIPYQLAGSGHPAGLGLQDWGGRPPQPIWKNVLAGTAALRAPETPPRLPSRRVVGWT
jgi:hypothetical protein